MVALEAIWSSSEAECICCWTRRACWRSISSEEDGAVKLAEGQLADLAARAKMA